MALFVLGDPHLSLGASKPMDIFPGWNDYVDRLEKKLAQAHHPAGHHRAGGGYQLGHAPDRYSQGFAFLQQLPGQKIIMKGNHDYWWSTANKMNAYLKAEGFDTLHILHNNSYSVEGVRHLRHPRLAVRCGRAPRRKVMNREIGRLRMSLQGCGARAGKAGCSCTIRRCIPAPVRRRSWPP